MILGRVVVASHNPDKVKEVEAVLTRLRGDIEIVRGLTWPYVEETESTLAGNALLKARMACAATGLVAIGDDTGLEVRALSGAPGVTTARFAGPDASYADNVTKLLEELEGMTDRAAVFRTVVALVHPDGTELIAEGALQGAITHRPRGSGGFGYDPVFEVDGRTLAEIGPDEKSEISHRARALRALAALVGSQPAG